MFLNKKWIHKSSLENEIELAIYFKLDKAKDTNH